MSRKQQTPWRRTAVAYDVMRGRPAKPDYGLLVVLMMVASAGGALIGAAVDLAVHRRAATRRAAATEPPPVESVHRSRVGVELREA